MEEKENVRGEHAKLEIDQRVAEALDLFAVAHGLSRSNFANYALALAVGLVSEGELSARLRSKGDDETVCDTDSEVV